MSTQDADRYRSGRLTGDGYAFRVAAKCRNVPLNPRECGDLVHQAVIPGRVMRGLAGQLWMRKKAERAKSIRYGDNDYAFVREPVAPVQGHPGPSGDVPAA